jgi:hypothetical protein
MDISGITDKKELAYMLIVEQRKLIVAQTNCRVIEEQLKKIESEESEPKKPTE